MRLERSVQLGAPAWPALAAGRWGGPLRVRTGDAEYAGKVALVDVDEDARVVGAHAQARRVGGWGGVAARLELRPDGGERRVAIAGEVQLSGEASEEAAEALLGGVAARLEDEAREPPPDAERAGPGLPAPVGAPAEESLADDPAYRRRLAARAAMAVVLGAAVGVAGAALGRRRS